MVSSAEILAAFREVSNTKQLDRSELYALLQDGILAALAKKYGPNVQAEVDIDDGKGDIRIVLLKTVVESVEDSSREISVDDARVYDDSFEIGDVMAQAAAGEARTLSIIIKADQGGPAEALADALVQLSTPEVKVEIVHRGVGAITESDILLAKTAGAIIIGFHVRPDNNARTAAEREGVDIKLYRIIYEAVADVRAAMEGMLRPEEREVILGEAEVREVFKISRIGTIAGCLVRNGVINRQGRLRVIRDGVEIFDGGVASLRRFKDDVREVREGFECGIGVENFNDIKVGDVIECYRTEEVARTLDSTPSA